MCLLADGDGDGDGGEEGGGDGDLTDAGSPSTPGQPGHLNQRLPRRAKRRHPLANKPQDFQVSLLDVWSSVKYCINDYSDILKCIRCYSDHVCSIIPPAPNQPHAQHFCPLSDPCPDHRGSSVAGQQHQTRCEGECMRTDPQDQDQERQQPLL